MANTNFPDPTPLEWNTDFDPAITEAVRFFRWERSMLFLPLTTIDVPVPAQPERLVRSSFDFFMTKEQALDIQWQQLTHYEKQWPGIRSMVVGMTTDHLLHSGVEYPIDVINQHIPRGGTIEAIWKRHHDNMPHPEDDPGYIEFPAGEFPPTN